MVDELHKHIHQRTMKVLEIALSGAGRGLQGRDGWSNLNNVQCKAIWNCHSKSLLYNEYILIK
jgi:hypothetical protein